MDEFPISNYFHNMGKQLHRKNCISCGKEVGWAKDKIAAHKRMRCTNISEDEKKFYDSFLMKFDPKMVI